MSYSKHVNKNGVKNQNSQQLYHLLSPDAACFYKKVTLSKLLLEANYDHKAQKGAKFSPVRYS